MPYSSGPGVIPYLKWTFLIVEIPTPKPYIFLIRVTRQIKCLIAQAPGVIPHPLPEVKFLMVEIPTPKPYIFMIRVTWQMKCLIAQALWGHTPPPTWGELFNGWELWIASEISHILFLLIIIIKCFIFIYLFQIFIILLIEQEYAF
jgi:hypothetical protein